MSEFTSRLKRLVRKVERFIIHTLIFMMSIVLILATIELGYHLVMSIINSTYFIIDLNRLMDLFGIFLLVLIGIELLDTIKVYFHENVIHVEIVVLVAIIAIARKVIIMDIDKYTGVSLLGVSAIIISLSLSYYLIKKVGITLYKLKEESKDDNIDIGKEVSDTQKKGSDPKY